MPRWVRGRNVVQFAFRAPPLEVEMPTVVGGQLRLTIDHLALKDKWILRSRGFPLASLKILYSSVLPCISPTLNNTLDHLKFLFRRDKLLEQRTGNNYSHRTDWLLAMQACSSL